MLSDLLSQQNLLNISETGNKSKAKTAKSTKMARKTSIDKSYGKKKTDCADSSNVVFNVGRVSSRPSLSSGSCVDSGFSGNHRYIILVSSYV